MPEDEKSFFEFLINDISCIILNQKSCKKRFTPLNNINLLKTPQLYWALVLVDPKTRIKAQFIKSTCGKKFNEHTYTFKVPKPHYLIDRLRAPVVELIRCTFNERQILTRGRIWVSYKYFGDQGIVYKGEAFQKFYEKIERWIKKNYTRQTLDYFGSEAMQYFREGGKIQGINDYWAEK